MPRNFFLVVWVVIVSVVCSIIAMVVVGDDHSPRLVDVKVERGVSCRIEPEGNDVSVYCFKDLR
jgi:hypothetical protein